MQSHPSPRTAIHASALVKRPDVVRIRAEWELTVAGQRIRRKQRSFASRVGLALAACRAEIGIFGLFDGKRRTIEPWKLRAKCERTKSAGLGRCLWGDAPCDFMRRAEAVWMGSTHAAAVLAAGGPDAR